MYVMTSTDEEILNYTIDQLERALLRNSLSDEQRSEKGRLGQFEYIGFSCEPFLKTLRTLQKIIPKKNPKFLDIGCGPGTKTYIASLLGFDSYGIEYSEEYLARSVLDKLHLWHQDAILFDYSAFDVIYFYRPFRKFEKQALLEERICKTASEGSIIFGVYSYIEEASQSYFDRPPASYVEKNGIKPIRQNLWVKMSDPQNYKDFMRMVRRVSNVRPETRKD